MRTTAVAAIIALALTLAYAAWLQPDWEPVLNDQFQYLSLARGIVERGEFTRARADEAFIPETNRLPGYPMLIAPTCIGGCDHWRIVLLHAGLYALLVVTAASLARRVAPRRAGMVALAVALYPPFAYFGALALSDVAGATFFAGAVLLWLRSLERRSFASAAVAGLLFGVAALMRGALLLAPLALATAAIARERTTWRPAAALVLATFLSVSPYVLYSETSFGRATGGNSGTVFFIGSLEGRDEATFDEFERAEVASARADIAAFDAMTDRHARALAWLVLDDSLAARGRALIAHDPLGWLTRSVYRSVELWTGERPVRGGSAGDAAILFAAAQLLLFGAALAGAALLARRRDDAAIAIVVVIVYVWASAVPFHTEARYSLPAMAFVIVAAVVVYDGWVERSRARAAVRA